MKKNQVITTLGGKEVGFLLGMMAYAEFEEEAGVSVEAFFKEAQSGTVNKKNIAILFKAANECYNFMKTGDGEKTDLRKVYFWLDELIENGELESVMAKLLNSPAPKEKLKESDSGKK